MTSSKPLSFWVCFSSVKWGFYWVVLRNMMTKLCTFNCQSTTLSTIIPYHLRNLNLSTLSPTRLALKSVKVQIMALLLPVTWLVRTLVFQSAKWAFYEYLLQGICKTKLVQCWQAMKVQWAPLLLLSTAVTRSFSGPLPCPEQAFHK